MPGVLVNEGPDIDGCGRGWYVVILTRPSIEPVAKQVTDQWKATTVTGRVWPALPKETVVPVDVGLCVVLVSGVVGTVTDASVSVGPDIVVPVNVGSGVVLAGRETGTVCDFPVDVELMVGREVDAACGVLVVQVDVGTGVVQVGREIGTEVDTVRGVPVVPIDVGPGAVTVGREFGTACGTVCGVLVNGGGRCHPDWWVDRCSTWQPDHAG